MKLPLAVVGFAGGWWGGFVFRTDAEKVLLLATGIVIALDWLTGVLGAYRVGEPITSTKMRAGVVKVIAYMALILLAIAMTQVLISEGVNLPGTPIVNGSLGLIFASEGLSVLENVRQATGFQSAWLERVLKGIADQADKKSEQGTQDS